jgi:hypothetical protein
VEGQVLGGERSSAAGGVDKGGLDGGLEARKVIHDGFSLCDSGCVAVPNNEQCSSAQVVAVLCLSQIQAGESESLQVGELQFGDEVSQHFLERAHVHGP